MKVLRTVLLLILLPFAAAAAPSDPGPAPGAYEAAMARGDALLAGDDYAGAEAAFREALQQGPGGAARADTLHKLAVALANQGSFAAAEPLIAEAETLVRNLRGPRSRILVDVLRAKTLVLYRTGRVAESRAAYREAKRVLEEIVDVWRTAPDDAWLHTPSGWRFAAAAPPFRRLRRTMLDETGHNVVVHYRIGAAGWSATLLSAYVSVERGTPLFEEYGATKHEIIREHPDAALLAEGPVAVDGFEGFRVALDLPPEDDGRVRRTALSAFERGPVLLRIRVSYPKEEAARREPEIATLIRTLLAGAPAAP